MKTKLIYFTVLISTLIGINDCIAQATSSDPTMPAPSANQPFGTLDYLGWRLNTIVGGLATGGTLIIPDLTIKNEDAMPIS